MLENLFNLMKEEGGDAVIRNPAIPNEKNDAVLADATQSVAEEFQGTLAGGGLQNVLSLFGNGGANTGGSSLLNNPIVSNIISNFTQKLTNNHGIASDQAGGIASSLIPTVISKLIGKTTNPGDSSFDINSIIGSLTGTGGGAAPTSGGGGFDLNSLLNKFSGGSLDTDGDGQIEFSDIVSKVTGGAKQQQSQQTQAGGEGGGLMDMIKGFMK